MQLKFTLLRHEILETISLAAKQPLSDEKELPMAS
jgi:hypothetical protein